MEQEIWLTIAIPTYNRLFKLKDIIAEILKHKENDIEILISDDSTNEDTLQYIQELGEPRVCYYRRDNKEVYPTLIKKARGHFVLIDLDKDLLLNRYLGELIRCLKNNPQLAYGYCRIEKKMDVLGNGKMQIFKKGIDALEHMAYRKWHRSGFIVNRNIITEDILSLDVKLWEPELSLLGDAGYCNMPIIRNENFHEAKKIKSIGEVSGNLSDLFFSPQGRKREMRIWIDHIVSKDYQEVIKRKLLAELFCRQIYYATIQFKTIIENKSLCIHYGIKSTKLSKMDFLKIELNFWYTELPYLLKMYAKSRILKVALLEYLVKTRILLFFR